MYGNHTATNRLMALVLLLSIFGFLCALIATFGPAWIVNNSDLFKWKLKEGIWLAQLCNAFGNECKISLRENILAEIGLEESLSWLSEKHWMEFKVLTILSIVESLAVVVIATITVVRKSKHSIYPMLLIVCFIACLSSCMFMLVPLLKISSVSTDLFDMQAWSIWVSGIAVLSQFITSCLLVVANYHNCRQSFKDQQQGAIGRNRGEIIMHYLASQHCSNNRNNQSENSNREDSEAWTSPTVRHSNTNSEIGSVRTSGGISSSMERHLPAYNEIVAP